MQVENVNELRFWLSKLENIDESQLDYFFQISKSLLSLIEKKYPIVVEEIVKKIQLVNSEYSTIAKPALKELNPIFELVKKGSEKVRQDKNETDKLQWYIDFMSGKESTSPEDVVSEKYTAIRLTLERFVNSGRLAEFKKYMKDVDGEYYLDFAKFPAYAEFVNRLEELNESKKYSWWEAYDFIKRILSDFSSSKNDIDFKKYLRNGLIKSFNYLILHLSQVDDDINIYETVKDGLKYEDYKLSLTKNSKTLEIVDFTNMTESRWCFETFWYFHTSGITNIRQDELLKRYNTTNKKSIFWSDFTKKVSTLLKVIKNRQLLAEKVDIHYDRLNKQYIFEIKT